MQVRHTVYIDIPGCHHCACIGLYMYIVHIDLYIRYCMSQVYVIVLSWHLWVLEIHEPRSGVGNVPPYNSKTMIHSNSSLIRKWGCNCLTRRSRQNLYGEPHQTIG